MTEAWHCAAIECMSTLGDNPITQSTEDLLGRGAAAAHLAAEIRDVDASQGYVVAIMGPWGAGKTSLVNLVRQELESVHSVPVIDFNPWMFSGAEQLVDSFFREIAAQLRIKEGRLARIAGEVEAYGELLSPFAWVPVVGTWFDRVRSTSSALRKFGERRQGSVVERRAQLAEKLAELEAPLAVVIDDIDRLQTNEIKDIFKLVRLTASFPNVIYVLAFDRARVEDALTETGLKGRSYLEKIVQNAVDLPVVPQEVLLRQITLALETAMNDVGELERFDGQRWPDVLMEIIAPLIRSMRDVRRYAAGVRSTVRALQDQVELVDVLALEAVRIFLPDVFQAVVKAQDGLTQPANSYNRDDSPVLKQSVTAIVAAAGDKEEVARRLVRRLFPAGLRHLENNHYGSDWMKTWLRSRQVAHIDILRLYLQWVAPESLTAFSDAERAYAVLDDAGALEHLLRSLAPDRLEDVIAALENFEGEYPPSSVVPATTVLLNLLPEIPERQARSPFAFDTRLVVVRVILRLLRQLDSPDKVEAAVEGILPDVRPLSSKLELIELVGHRESVGSKLISEEAAARLEDNFLAILRSQQTQDLLEERDLLRLVLIPTWWQEDGRPAITVLDNPDVNAALLTAARSYVTRQEMGNRAIQREAHLSWDSLSKIYGSEERVQAAVEGLKERAQSNPDLEETVTLAEKYLAGWRPKRFVDDD